MTDKERYLSLCSSIKRDGINNLIDWLEKSDFFTAPASTRFHGSYAGGLCEHSLHVYDEMKRLLQVYPEIKVSEETIIITTLFHDLCKVNNYAVEKRNRKNESGQWESYDAFITKPKLNYGGHGSKSVFITQQFIKLTTEEAVAINCHMSAFDGDVGYIGMAYEQFPYAWLLSAADQSATYVVETKKEG